MSACAKSPSVSPNEEQRKYFDAWIQLYHPGAVRTPLGAYILEDREGDGIPVGLANEHPYLRVNYKVADMEGNVIATNSEALSKQLGLYSESSCYNPEVWDRSVITVGLEESVQNMRVGGRRTLFVPGWLSTNIIYVTPEEYFVNVTDGTEYVYDFELVDALGDIVRWETDSVCAYMRHNYPKVSVLDSLRYGYYYVRTGEPSDTAAYPADGHFNINYIGRLLDGKVFDTSIKDTAKFYGIYSEAATYKSQQVNCAEDYTGYTMGDSKSSVIDGFAYALHRMRPGEKCTVIFHSLYGYSVSGSGAAIPPYSPLRFDIEIVDE